MFDHIDLGGGILIDVGDFETVALYNWYVDHKAGRGYVVATFEKGSRQVPLHRFLLKPAKGQVVDHINGDRLDNRRSNLRLCSHKENIRNRRKLAKAASRFKGVRLSSAGNWRAEIEQNGNRLHLGTFKEEVRAAKQYDRAARIFFGSFALTNEKLGLFL